LTIVQTDCVGFTEANLQKEFVVRWMWHRQRYKFIVPNCYLDWSDFTEFDLLCVRKSGFIDEIEIKRTVSDFRADFRKSGRFHLSKHEQLKSGNAPANYFSFLMYEELGAKIEDEIPEHAGLFVLTSTGWVVEKKKAPRLHTKKIGERTMLKLGEKMMSKYWRLVK